jgi:hypothetical protein
MFQKMTLGCGLLPLFVKGAYWMPGHLYKKNVTFLKKRAASPLTAEYNSAWVLFNPPINKLLRT